MVRVRPSGSRGVWGWQGGALSPVSLPIDPLAVIQKELGIPPYFRFTRGFIKEYTHEHVHSSASRFAHASLKQAADSHSLERADVVPSRGANTKLPR
jgi:hypothetical protein